MKSPFTNGNTHLKTEKRIIEYRKEKFSILYHVYVCEDTGEEFTTDELDNLNIIQVHNRYREKYGIPFPDQIKDIRKKYGLSAAKMSEVLGFGPNSYRYYETGDVPSVSNARLISLASDPNEFMKILEMSKNLFDKEEYTNLMRKAIHSITPTADEISAWTKVLFKDYYPNIWNGYKLPDLKKIGNMVSFFSMNINPFTTVLNKLMFYSDFFHYKKHGCSISGIYYKAISHGPVPENFGGIYNQVVNAGYANVEEVDFGEFTGERFIPTNLFDKDYLSEVELKTLDQVSIKFKGKSTAEIVKISHEELAWIDNVGEQNHISFEYSFILKHFK